MRAREVSRRHVLGGAVLLALGVTQLARAAPSGIADVDYRRIHAGDDNVPSCRVAQAA
jgi:hypothetical protein